MSVHANLPRRLYTCPCCLIIVEVEPVVLARHPAGDPGYISEPDNTPPIAVSWLVPECVECDHEMERTL